MKTELIKWYEPSEKMPDAETTVLVDTEDHCSAGYWDDEKEMWCDIKGVAITDEVIGWAEQPYGINSKKPCLLDASKEAAEHERAFWDNHDQDEIHFEPSWLAELERVIEEVAE